MGKKHKKQARKQRLVELRTRQQQQTSKPGRKSKPQPLRSQPIVFVRGDDYEPVKYAMGDGKNMVGTEMRPRGESDDNHGTENSPGAPVGTPNEFVVARQDTEVLETTGRDYSLIIDPEQAEPVEPVEPVEQVTLDLVALDSSELVDSEEMVESVELLETDSGEHVRQSDSEDAELVDSVEIDDFEPDIDQKIDDPLDFSDTSLDSAVEIHPNEPLDYTDSDSSELFFSESDSPPLDYEPVEGTSYFGDYAVLSEGDYSDDETMAQDIDYNDMGLDDLVRLGIGIDQDYDIDDLDYDVDSDADDVIAGLLAGDSLNSFARPGQRQPKRQKKELSKRRRARIEAREAERQINFGKCPPLWQKYPEQMTVHQVVEELQVLVYTPNLQELRFPPLDHNANWYVSELSKLHGLKIKSYTAAKSNCVLVLKTSRAMVPDGPHRAKMGQLMHRRQTFRRVDISTESRDPRDPRDPRGPKTKVKSARPKEGDIVGENAKEVAEGFGHRLMKQMGWSVGTGLGSQRDGIQLPLLARVKLTKKGLRE